MSNVFRLYWLACQRNSYTTQRLRVLSCLQKTGCFWHMEQISGSCCHGQYSGDRGDQWVQFSNGQNRTFIPFIPDSHHDCWKSWVLPLRESQHRPIILVYRTSLYALAGQSRGLCWTREGGGTQWLPGGGMCPFWGGGGSVETPGPAYPTQAGFKWYKWSLHRNIEGQLL